MVLFQFHVFQFVGQGFHGRCDVVGAQGRGSSAHNAELMGVRADDSDLLKFLRIQRQQPIVFEQYQRLTQRFFKQNNTGDLMNRISEDVGKVRMYVGPAIMYALNTGFTIILVISIMLSVSPKLTLLTLAPLPLLAFLIYKVANLINVKSLAVQKQLSTLSTFSQESFSGMRVKIGRAHV